MTTAPSDFLNFKHLAAMTSTAYYTATPSEIETGIVETQMSPRAHPGLQLGASNATRPVAFIYVPTAYRKVFSGQMQVDEFAPVMLLVAKDGMIAVPPRAVVLMTFRARNGSAMARWTLKTSGNGHTEVGPGHEESRLGLPKPHADAPPQDHALYWLLEGQCSRAAVFMCYRLSGVRLPNSNPKYPYLSYPQSVEEFQSCLEFLEWVPCMRERLSKMAEVCPEWAIMVERWEQISIQLRQEQVATQGFTETKRLIESLVGAIDLSHFIKPKIKMV
jgi:hypothetical protein